MKYMRQFFHRKVNLTVNYDGADLTRFTYYNADKLNESGSVISEYKDGVITKETVYTSDYKDRQRF